MKRVANRFSLVDSREDLGMSKATVNFQWSDVTSKSGNRGDPIAFVCTCPLERALPTSPPAWVRQRDPTSPIIERLKQVSPFFFILSDVVVPLAGLIEVTLSSLEL